MVGKAESWEVVASHANLWQDTVDVEDWMSCGRELIDLVEKANAVSWVIVLKEFCQAEEVGVYKSLSNPRRDLY